MTAASFTANLAAYLLQTTLLLAAGLLLPPLFGLRDPQVRLRYWRALLVFALALPFAGLLAGSKTAAGVSITSQMAEGMDLVVTAGSKTFAPWPWVLALLAGVVLARLAWILTGLVALARLRNRSPVLDPLPLALSESLRDLGVKAEIRVTDRLGSPLTFGRRSPVILLPKGIEAMDAQVQRCIALHELIHVKRGDWLAVLIEEGIRGVLWFHPAVWLVLDRIALCREQVVDREVVRLTHQRKPYMNTLAAMARLRQSAAAVAILPFFHRSHLLQRLALLTQEVSMSKFRLGLAVAGSAFALLLAGAVAAGAFPLLAGDDHPPAAKLVVPGSSNDDILSMGSIKAPKVIKQVNPVYPEEAREKGLGGRVVLEIVINKKGEATQVKIVTSANEIFNASAIEAVSQWRYEIPRRDGKPVNVRWIITINFTATK